MAFIEIVGGLLLVVGSVLVIRAVMLVDGRTTVTSSASESSEKQGSYRKAA